MHLRAGVKLVISSLIHFTLHAIRSARRCRPNLRLELNRRCLAAVDLAAGGPDYSHSWRAAHETSFTRLDPQAYGMSRHDFAGLTFLHGPAVIHAETPIPFLYSSQHGLVAS
jgi:hypothetical protein